MADFLEALAVAEKEHGVARGKGSVERPATAASKATDEEELVRAEEALRYLIANELIDLGSYDGWRDVMFALHSSYGDKAFPLFLQLSQEHDGFEVEEDCRKKWDAIRAPEDRKPLTIATFFKMAKEAGWKPARKGASSGDDHGGLPKGTDPAAYVLTLAEEAGDEFWLDQHDKPHVSFTVSLPNDRLVQRHAPIASSTYKIELAQRFIEALETKVLKDDQASLAVSLMEHRARAGGTRYRSALRVGEHEGRLYVDLGYADAQSIEIDDTDWRLVDQSPVRFVRGSRGELPLPRSGGTLADFQRHFNLSPDDLLKLVGFMIGTFNVEGSYAILATEGEQGSGKSTLNDKVVALVDPPREAKEARMSFTPKEQDLHIAALGVHVPYFDNVSTFSGDASDALCRLATGGGSSARKLYSDDQEMRLVVTRPVVITSIGAPSSRPDLLSRSIRITALTLTGQRMTERKVMRGFYADRPKMFGFLLSCVSAAIRNRDAVEEAVDNGDFDLPRLADFAEFVEGAHEQLGLGLGEFSVLIEQDQAVMQREAVLGTPIGGALMSYFSRPGATSLNAYARDILAMLRDIMPQEQRWPQPNMLRKALSRISVGLRALGIEWDVSKGEGHDNVAKFSIRTTPSFKPIELKADDPDDGGGHF